MNPKLRASMLPQVAACPAYATETANDPNISHPRAICGTMIHEVAKLLALGNEPDTADLAARYNMPAKEIEFALSRMHFARAVVDHIKAGWTVLVEHPVMFDGVTGTLDLAMINPAGDFAIVYDWKTGFVEVGGPKDNAQIQLYSIALALTHGIGKVEAHIYSTEHWTDTAHAWEGDEIHAVAERLIEIIAAAREDRPEYRPGLCCEYCPARTRCKALHWEITPLAIGEWEEMPEDSPANIFRNFAAPEQAELLTRARLAIAVADKIIEAAKLHVLETGQPIPLGNGEEFGFRTQPGNRDVDPVTAWPVLEQHLGTDGIAECIKVSLSDAEEAAKARVRASGGKTRGAIGKAAKALVDDLTAAGAITRGPERKIFSVRPVAAGAIEAKQEEENAA